ncbi:MAG: SSI family serine proteinase inhibitor [Gaiellaceae bacterium]
MRRAAIVILLASAGCSGSGSGAGDTPSPPGTELVIRVWPNGMTGPAPRRWTLRCDPAGGTLPKAEEACERLSTLDEPFAPVPSDVACAAIYGGPAEGEVTGRHDDEQVSVRFNRTSGREIDRWETVRFLFPVGV